MAIVTQFTEEEMIVDEGLGYPRAYVKLCRNPNLSIPYNHGPPFTYIPYALPTQEALRAKDFKKLFPVIDSERKPSTNPRNYVSLLWKQLSHLGNAGFDPAKFRVDMYGNVLYFHADSASPLAWDIDHWFPCSRGGRTLPSNLRILQWQVCKKKHNKLEFLIPWWDLQLGVSVNQFILIFASTNSDFRNRAFSWLFLEGENEELNDSQSVESHTFPQHFIEIEQEVGPAAAAIVSSRRDLDASPLKSLDLNRTPRLSFPAIATRKLLVEEDDNKAIQRYRPCISKENKNCDMGRNDYVAIVVARDSLKQKEEAEKKKAEIHQLENELNELKQSNEAERLSLQELEYVLIKRRRRVEKCRRLAESQSSYRTLLEKMIRDAMHQNVVYKEQTRLNQAANSALMARLEAQQVICDSSEKELRRKFKQREGIENQIRPYCEHARKRSRNDDAVFEERYENTPRLLLPGTQTRRSKPLQKELRLFLEEEKKASEAGISLDEEREREKVDDERKEASTTKTAHGEKTEKDLSLIVPEDETALDDELWKLAIKDGNSEETNEKKEIASLVTKNLREEENGKGNSEEANIKKEIASLVTKNMPEEEVDEEYRKKVGKGNVDKWLQMLLENTEDGGPSSDSPEDTYALGDEATEIIQKLNLKYPQKEIKFLRLEESKEKVESSQKDTEMGSNQKETEVVPKSKETNGSDFKCTKASKERVGSNQMNTKMMGPNREDVKVVARCKETNGSEIQVEGRDSENRRENSIMLEKSCKTEMGSGHKGVGSSKSFEKSNGKEGGLARCESARTFRTFPSSPSMILRRGVDCMGKKPMVVGDDDGIENYVTGNNKIINSCTRAIKKTVKK